MSVSVLSTSIGERFALAGIWGYGGSDRRRGAASGVRLLPRAPCRIRLEMMFSSSVRPCGPSLSDNRIISSIAGDCSMSVRRRVSVSCWGFGLSTMQASYVRREACKPSRLLIGDGKCHGETFTSVCWMNTREIVRLFVSCTCRAAM